MRRIAIAALLAGQMLTAAPLAAAADLAEGRSQHMGAFAGVRLRIPLGGDAHERQARAGLTLSPTLHSRGRDGATRLRFGEGVELGLTDSEPVRLSIGGTPVSQIARGGAAPDGPRRNMSTAGWIGVGLGTVVVILGVAYLVVDDWADCDDDEECN